MQVSLRLLPRIGEPRATISRILLILLPGVSPGSEAVQTNRICTAAICHSTFASMLGNLSLRTMCQPCAGHGYERARGLRESCVECRHHNSVLIRNLRDFWVFHRDRGRNRIALAGSAVSFWRWISSFVHHHLPSTVCRTVCQSARV
jgi:hypothetical protein